MNAIHGVKGVFGGNFSGGCMLNWQSKILASVVAAFLVAIGTASAGAASDARGGAMVKSAYAQVDDIRIYYEMRGAGEPIIMLHGAYGTTGTWAPCAAILAQHFLVITLDLRGRGRTGDGDGPISAGRTARDVIGLMDHLGLRQAHVVGHSAGSITAVSMLIDYPDRVRSATLVGNPLMALRVPNDAMRKLQRDMESLRDGLPVVSDPDLARFAEQLRKTAPDPNRIPIVMGKLRRIGAVYAEDALATITRPVLVSKAGRDALIPPESFDRLAAAIPGSTLIDFPNGTHGLPRQEASRLAVEIQNFIDARQSVTK